MDSREIEKRLGIGKNDFRLVIGRTGIEYDESKELQNRTKHGYSLESAAYLLEKVLLSDFLAAHFCYKAPVIVNGETRHQLMILDDQNQVIFLVCTMRENEKVRVISCRRASMNEREAFRAVTGFAEEAS